MDDHSGYDKSFYLWAPHLCLEVDYDDVNHDEVDAATQHLMEIIKEHWNEDVYNKYYLVQLKLKWEENAYNLQKDYDSLEDYLKQHGH